MTKLFVVVPLLLLPALAAGAPPEATPPDGLVSVSTGGSVLTLWPYTYQLPAAPGEPQDPVNLVFLDSDPRGIRQVLLALDGSRSAFPPVAPFDCRWTDAMGNEQASWAEPDGWVGSEVQLACVAAGAPLGNPFRFHLRLYRHGSVTLGAAHLDFKIPGTAEHEAIAWDFARSFVAFDIVRSGTSGPPSGVPLVPAGTFRTIRRPIYQGLYAGGAAPIMAAAGLPVPPPPGSADVPIPTNGVALVFAPQVELAPVQEQAVTTYDVTYDVVTTKPFCNGPADYVRLQGPLHFELRTHTNPSGTYERVYELSGTLTVTPLAPTATGLVPSGPQLSAPISEHHRALLTDHYGQVNEQVTRILASDTPDSYVTEFAAGHVDAFSTTISCAAP